jgi:hypothetical protein
MQQPQRISRPRQATKESDPASACQSANPTQSDRKDSGSAQFPDGLHTLQPMQTVRNYVHVGFRTWGEGVRGPRSYLGGQWRVSPSVIMSRCSSRSRTT